MNTYTPNPNRIIHNTSVDFQKRMVCNPIHIVQYDTGTPIVAVSLYSNNATYTLPEGVTANIRLKKRDGKVVYNPVLGCNAERNVLYFEVTYQMTVIPGLVRPILELVIDAEANVAASSSIEIEIDKNPIQQSNIDSSDEMQTVVGYALLAKQSADAAKVSEENALASEQASKTSETNAKTSETKAKTSETNAKSSENKAKTSETNAKTSETNAAVSESNAADSEAAAHTSETNAKTSETNAKTSETNAEASATAAANSEAKAKEYADAAKVSETNSKASETNAKTSETNAATSEVNAKESETNAKTSEGLAEAAKDLAVTSAETATEAADVAMEAANSALSSAVKAQESDVGRLILALERQELSVSVKDFTDDVIFDNEGNPIESVTTFVAADKFAELSDKVDKLLTEIENMKSHALLDSSY